MGEARSYVSKGSRTKEDRQTDRQTEDELEKWFSGYKYFLLFHI